MIIDCYRYCLLRFLLTHNILIQHGLNLMRRRYILHRKLRCFLFTLLFLYALTLRNLHSHRTELAQIHHLDIERHPAHIEAGNIRILERIHRLLHTLTADVDSARHLNDRSALALRAAADIAQTLIIVAVVLAGNHFTVFPFFGCVCII